MNIIFPEVSVRLSVGKRTKKNQIIHLIQATNVLDCTIDWLSNNCLVLNDTNSIEYFTTSDRNNIPSDKDYVLLAKKFTKKDISTNKIVLLEWLKHPRKKIYLPDEITDSWSEAFNFKKENPEKNILGLRTPQIGAIHAVLAHLTNAKETGNIILPTGTGKTETMLAGLIANQCAKVLITVPSDSLRGQISNKFYNLGLLKTPDINGECIVKEKALYPIVGILNTGFEDNSEIKPFFDSCNVIISTMDLLTKSVTPFQQTEISNFCSHLFVDEAHHSMAKNWNTFIKRFDKGKVIQFTATPYRNDGKLLDGKAIYNFTLKEAQDQGYFKEIDFIPIREYDQHEADNKIAETAVKKLREDLKTYDHILMARCEDKIRANEVFKIYSQYTDLKPVLIHSSVLQKEKIKQSIIKKEHRIIVCVDMLGEGFDLPELKIAAFHDIRKSLPITLQFAGRFTRTSRDSHLGKASFIANLFQPKIDDELALLYVKDSNWNTILPTLSYQATQEQIDLREFLSGFENIEESVIPYQDVRPAFSAVVYKNSTDEWNPRNFHVGIKGYELYDYKFYDINSKHKTLVVFLGNKKNVDWGNFADVYNIEWNIFIAYWETKKNALFINSSEKGEFKELAKAIIGDNATLVKDEDVFKTFFNISRIKLFNVGLRKALGKDISFQSYYGKGVQDALSEFEERTSIKNNVFGAGFENGDMASMGCSRKGKIWSYARGTINEFTKWCDAISLKLFNQHIDGKKILLQNTIKPQKISTRPQNLYPIAVDWNAKMYKEHEGTTILKAFSKEFDLSSMELNVHNPSLTGDLMFEIKTITDERIIFKQNLFVNIIEGESVFDYTISPTATTTATIKFGSQLFNSLEDFFSRYPPIFWFADGSFLQGYEYVKFNEEILLFPKENLIAYNWQGVNLSQESEKFNPIRPASIQAYMFNKLMGEDYDILYNDDDSGEIADIVAIKNLEKSITIVLYHLKFANEGKVSNEIKNFYEVCGQAQKSLSWKYKEGKEFIEHLIKREFKKNKDGLTRLKKGTIEDLENMLESVKRTKPLNFEIYIVQPSLSKDNPSEGILNLLNVTFNHLKRQGNIDLKVIVNE